MPMYLDITVTEDGGWQQVRVPFDEGQTIAHFRRQLPARPRLKPGRRLYLPLFGRETAVVSAVRFADGRVFDAVLGGFRQRH